MTKWQIFSQFRDNKAYLQNVPNACHKAPRTALQLKIK